jgi:hypothetical protein
MSGLKTNYQTNNVGVQFFSSPDCLYDLVHKIYALKV